MEQGRRHIVDADIMHPLPLAGVSRIVEDEDAMLSVIGVVWASIIFEAIQLPATYTPTERQSRSPK